jgi:5'-nucleotidase
MKILLTNDEGVSAAGLLAMKNALLDLGDLQVVAPAGEQSGMSLALTYLGPIQAGPANLSDGYEAHQVHGTPVDCVKFALLELFEEAPDLVVSGLNVGLNTGVNVMYSGTVAAALEASMGGVASVAFSTVPGDGGQIEWAAGQSRRVLDMLLDSHDGMARTYNVNIPDSTDSPPACVYTKQAREPFKERYRPAGRKGAYRLETATNPVQGVDDDTDVGALLMGRISVTPLTADLTDSECLRRSRGSESVLA